MEMESSVSAAFVKKGSILRKRCAQIKASESYFHNELLFLSGRSVVAEPRGQHLIILSPLCLQRTTKILSDLITNSAISSVFIFLQTAVLMAIDSIPQQSQREIKKMLFELNSSHSLLFLNEANDRSTLPPKHMKATEFQLVRAVKACCLLQEMATVQILGLNQDDHFLLACQRSGLKTSTLFDYSQQFLSQDSCALLQSIQDSTSEEESPGVKDAYPSLKSPDAVATEISRGTLLKGIINVYGHNPFMAEVSTQRSDPLSPGRHMTVLVEGRKNLNRAFDGDEVAVELLPESEWHSSISYHYLVDAEGDAEPAPAPESAITGVDPPDNSAWLANHILGLDQGRMPTGKVVAIIKRKINLVLVNVPSSDTGVMADRLGQAQRPTGREEFLLTIPLEKKLPKFRIKTRQANILQGCRISIAFDDWPMDSMFPNGHLVSIVGDLQDWRTEIDSLLIQNSIFPRPFSYAAMNCLPIVPNDSAIVRQKAATLSDLKERRREAWVDSQWSPSAEQLLGRRDLRTERHIFSVDPFGCQDIDDSMSAQWLETPGKLEVAVMIADVCAFVNQDSPLDLEAQARGTTVYLPHTRFDMLPTVLSSDIASLHAEKDRLAVCVNWVIDVLHADGRPVSASEDPLDLDDQNDIQFVMPPETASWMGRVVMSSVAAMTYEQAHNLILGLDPDHGRHEEVPIGQAGRPVREQLWTPLRKDLRILTAFSRFLKRRRAASGAVEVVHSSGSELKFDMTVDESLAGVHGHENLEIHDTIAELMILANSTVAFTLEYFNPSEALVRIHPPTNVDKLEAIKATVNSFGIPTSASNQLQEQLHNLRNHLKSQRSSENEMGVVLGLISSIVVRSMNEARYVCVGTLSGQLFSEVEDETSNGDNSRRNGHFGLGLSHYTHFTSPIRRYADMVVHRQLLAILESPLGLRPPVTNRSLKKSLSTTKPSTSANAVIPQASIPSVFHLTDTKSINVNAIDREKIEIEYLDDLLSSPPMPCRPTVASAAASSSIAEVDPLDDLLSSPSIPCRPTVASAAASSSIAEVDPLDDLLASLQPDIDIVKTVPHQRPLSSSMPLATFQIVEELATSAASGTSCPTPYTGQQVALIAEHLNTMNRRSKRLQSQCQELFLNMYLRSKVEVHVAKVYALRENGFLAYIPAYDYKGPVFLTDRTGLVCIDASLLTSTNVVGPSVDCPEGFLGRSDSRLGAVRGYPLLSSGLRKDDNGGDFLAIRSTNGDILLRLDHLQTVSVEITASPISETHPPTIRLSLASSSAIPVSNAHVSAPDIVNAVTALEPAKRDLTTLKRDKGRSIVFFDIPRVKRLRVQQISIGAGKREGTSFLKKGSLLNANVKVIEDHSNIYRNKLLTQVQDKRHVIEHSGRIAFGAPDAVRAMFLACANSRSHGRASGEVVSNRGGSDAVLHQAAASLAVGKVAAMAKMAAWGEAWADEEDLPEVDEAAGVGETLPTDPGMDKTLRKEVVLASARIQKLNIAKRRSRYEK